MNDEEIKALQKDDILMKILTEVNKNSGTSLEQIIPGLQPVSTLLYWSAINGALARAKIKEALKSGADVNEIDQFGYTPLKAAVENGVLENVKLFLENGADINLQSDGQTALELAQKNGHHAVVSLIEDYNKR